MSIPHACPVCRGHGTVSKPPYVAGDQDSWAGSGTGSYPCHACSGTGIVWEVTGVWPAVHPHGDPVVPQDYTNKGGGA